MSHLHPRAKIALGILCLTLSMSVTFFNPPTPTSRISLTSFAEVRRIERTDSEAAAESERLLREVTALHEDLSRMDRIDSAVSSPAP